jgi:DNA-binding GntR family transcriptional regulator
MPTMAETSLLAVESVEAATYRVLRDAIVRLALAPGERLYAKELAERYGVSEMPVRQALRRLAAERLVETRPRRATVVAPLSDDEIEEIQAIRFGVEGLLARHGAEATTQAVLVELEAQLAQTDDAYRSGDRDAYISAQGAFRDVCYQAARRPRLLAIAVEQRRRVERYFRYLFSDMSALAESREHQLDLLAACRECDGAAAEASTQAALTWTLERIGALVGAERAERS